MSQCRAHDIIYARLLTIEQGDLFNDGRTLTPNVFLSRSFQHGELDLKSYLPRAKMPYFESQCAAWGRPNRWQRHAFRELENQDRRSQNA